MWWLKLKKTQLFSKENKSITIYITRCISFLYLLFSLKVDHDQKKTADVKNQDDFTVIRFVW
jgi:hypothetical protein